MDVQKYKNSVVGGLLAAGAFLNREGDRILREFGLNQQQFVLLKEIQEKGPIRQKELCSGLLLEKSNVSKIVKKLTKTGLALESKDNDDGRAAILNISSKGERRIKNCMAVLNGWNEKWLEMIPEDELKTLASLLRKLKRDA